MSYKVYDFVCTNKNCEMDEVRVEELVNNDDIPECLHCNRPMIKVATVIRAKPIISKYDAFKCGRKNHLRDVKKKVTDD